MFRPVDVRRVAAALALLAVVAACDGSGRQTERGVVIDVAGDLSSVESFVLLTPDGDRLVLAPAEGIRFHGGAPIAHLAEHLRSGDAVEVVYVELDDGTLEAVEITDAG